MAGPLPWSAILWHWGHSPEKRGLAFSNRQELPSLLRESGWKILRPKLIVAFSDAEKMRQSKSSEKAAGLGLLGWPVLTHARG